MTVYEYIKDYIEDKGTYCSFEEAEVVNSGIRQYLLENGIDEGEEREYYKKYVIKNIHKIDERDLTVYFKMYNIYSKINQIIIESRNSIPLSEKRKEELLSYLTEMNKIGLGDKYLPIIEIKGILGENI